MPQPFTDVRQTSQPLPPSPTPALADALPPAPGNAADAAPTILRDLVLQAVQRAQQAQLRAQAEAQALQARNAFD